MQALIHKNKIILSSLHKWLKFNVYCIKGDLKPFDIHEMEIYEDVVYYLPSYQSLFSLYQNEEERENKKK